MNLKFIHTLNLFLRGLVCSSVLSFAILSLGGEFLHSHLHNHALEHECTAHKLDHEQTTAHEDGQQPVPEGEEECLLFQLLAQAFITFEMAIFPTQENIRSSDQNAYPLVFSNTQLSLPYLRGPPVFS